MSRVIARGIVRAFAGARLLPRSRHGHGARTGGAPANPTAAAPSCGKATMASLGCTLRLSIGVGLRSCKRDNVTGFLGLPYGGFIGDVASRKETDGRRGVAYL